MLALGGTAVCAPAGAPSRDAVNPGDSLTVTVYNHPELGEQVKVDSRGGISVPLAGYLSVSGMSLAAIDALIGRRLAPYIKFPAVDVQAAGETQSIFVAGGPGGVLLFSPGETLATALEDVQKSLQRDDPQENNRIVINDLIDHSRLDLRKVGVTRNGHLVGVYDTIAMRSTLDPGPVLHANDTIVFQNKPIAVLVSGHVAKPGHVYLDEAEPLSDAIEQAGGTSPGAASSHVVITLADQTTRTVTLGDPAFAKPATAGEEVYIPIAPRVQVNGLVAKPGPVELQSDFTLLGAINSAGGINKFANIKDVQLMRNGTTTSYDITKLTYGDMSQNPTLQDGDSIFLPEGHKIDFSTVFGTILGIRGAL
jgi:protein involved in polysaccharide export with SLBB domain